MSHRSDSQVRHSDGRGKQQLAQGSYQSTMQKYKTR